MPDRSESRRCGAVAATCYRSRTFAAATANGPRDLAGRMIERGTVELIPWAVRLHTAERPGAGRSREGHDGARRGAGVRLHRTARDPRRAWARGHGARGARRPPRGRRVRARTGAPVPRGGVGERRSGSPLPRRSARRAARLRLPLASRVPAGAPVRGGASSGVGDPAPPPRPPVGRTGPLRGGDRGLGGGDGSRPGPLDRPPGARDGALEGRGSDGRGREPPPAGDRGPAGRPDPLPGPRAAAARRGTSGGRGAGAADRPGGSFAAATTSPSNWPGR